MPKFTDVPKQFSFPKNELEILKLWDRISAFQKSVDSKKGKESSYVFYDGPPFATGTPHYGHFVASVLKDVVPRFWTMRGKHIERRFGWDTHGLPVEMLVEGQLGLKGPTAIREYGVDKFNEACRASVLKYTEEWRRTITRLGRWVDFDNDYKTMDPNYMESVWWVFSELYKKGLVYKGFRVMPFSTRLSTPLSNFEANMDYRDVQDPAITFTMPLKNDALNRKLLVWTTTPWTLPSNLAVAVHEDMDYVDAKKEGDDALYVVAKALVHRVLGKDAEIQRTYKGKELLSLAYEPLFPYFKDFENAFCVLASGHVTSEDGTGLVHMAPAFGQDDFEVCKRYNIDLVNPIDDEGKFTAEVSDYEGLDFKEADPKIIRKLKADGRIFKHETINHAYPFCWRSKTPLMYRATPVWFVKVTALKDKMIKNNEAIHWVPDAVGKKRFGNWLKDAQDWSISRSRFWGTPIPLWTCSKCDALECIGSTADLAKKGGEKVLDLHSHKIDHLTWGCEKCDGTMKRIPEVFDCWFDSGSMPYAQVHYPFENAESFKSSFPGQFIAEGLDQTRGWFYTLLVLSTALFDKPPFENVVVNGMVLAEDGSKMSKSKQNYPDPNIVLEAYGADALRAYLINSPVVRAEPLAFKEQGVKEVVRSVMLPLYNAWSFFVQYANVDGWEPAKDLKKAPNYQDRSEMDRWILSKLQSLVEGVNTNMEGYYLYKVVGPIMAFIDDLTNWYIRRSRRRFWKNANSPEEQADKDAAYATLYEVLVTFSKVLAPLLPFIAETLYQNLVVNQGQADKDQESVHLCDFPKTAQNLVDRELENSVEVTRQVVKLGRVLRERHKIKTRQPLARVTVVTHDNSARKALLSHAHLIEQELNVKDLQVVENDDALCSLQFKANFKTLGKRLGKKMGAASKLIAQFTKHEFDLLQKGESVSVLDDPLTLEDVLVTRTAKEGVVVESHEHITVALDTTLDDELRSEGLVRELISLLQKSRKDEGFEISDRIDLWISGESEDLKQAIKKHDAFLKAELLAKTITLAPEKSGALERELKVEDVSLRVTLIKSE